MELQQNLLQQGIFSYINGKVVKMYLSNMHSVYGKVLATDNFTVLIQPFDEKNKGENKTNLIYKSSIVNIEINTLIDTKKLLNHSFNNQSLKSNHNNKNNKLNNNKNTTSKVKEQHFPSNDISLQPISSKTHSPKEIIIGKYNTSKEDSDALPELNVFNNDEININEQNKKIDNAEEMQENSNEKAKYSPMNFLNDLQS